jgi:N-acyl-D-amino-acid deacylase
MASEILFLSPTVISGEEEADPYVADVLISDGLIARIGQPGTIEAASARKVDAKGFYLSPGFIDMHAHSDLYLLTNPAHEAKITQGCTVSVSLAKCY